MRNEELEITNYQLPTTYNQISQYIANSPGQKITFAEYMDWVLYHPQWGYYGSGKANIGSQGDFFTSSSLGSDFGELLALQLVQMWLLLGEPNPFILVEMGAGSGLLASDILHYLQQNQPNLFQCLQYIIVEQATGLISQQQQQLQPWLNQDVNLSWCSWEEIAENSITGCFFSNELVDAFPIHQITLQQGQLQEIYVASKQNQLVEVIDKPSTPKLAEYFNLVGIDLASDAYPDNYRSEVNLAALDWLKKVAQRLDRGYVITIDYGYSAPRYYHPQRYQGTLKCYYQQRHHHNPYVNLGLQDITAHIDFTALEVQGEFCGLHKVGFTQQAMFLMALGLGERLAALSKSNIDIQQLLSRRDALHQLINPTGLGKFGVLIQGTHDCSQSNLQGLYLGI